MRFVHTDLNMVIFWCLQGAWQFQTPILFPAMKRKVNPGIRSWKQHSSKWAWRQKTIGGIYFTKKWTAETLQPGLEFDNFKPRFQRQDCCRPRRPLCQHSQLLPSPWGSSWPVIKRHQSQKTTLPTFTTSSVSLRIVLASYRTAPIPEDHFANVHNFFREDRLGQ
jgi:hypothetical protein